jgi:hypothetical protein
MHGGKRIGAGRPAGSANKANREQRICISNDAKQYGALALKALAEIAAHGVSESARVSAATAILNRAYGRPNITTTEENVDLPAIVISRPV